MSTDYPLNAGLVEEVTAATAISSSSPRRTPRGEMETRDQAIIKAAMLLASNSGAGEGQAQGQGHLGSKGIDQSGSAQEELIEMHRVVSHLRQRVETLDLDAVKTKAELRRTRIVNRELEEKNRQLAVEAHAEAMARVSAEDARQQENEEMQAMVQKLSERMEMLDAEANKTKAELRRLRAQNQDLAETVRLGEAGAETVAAELKAKDDLCRDLQKRLERSQKELREKVADIEDLQARLEEAQGAQQKRLEETSEFKDRLAKSEGKRTDLERKVKELEEHRAAGEAAFQEVNKEVEAFKEKSEEMQQELSLSQAKAIKLEEEIATLQASVAFVKQFPYQLGGEDVRPPAGFPYVSSGPDAAAGQDAGVSPTARGAQEGGSAAGQAAAANGWAGGLAGGPGGGTFAGPGAAMQGSTNAWAGAAGGGGVGGDYNGPPGPGATQGGGGGWAIAGGARGGSNGGGFGGAGAQGGGPAAPDGYLQGGMAGPTIAQGGGGGTGFSGNSMPAGMSRLGNVQGAPASWAGGGGGGGEGGPGIAFGGALEGGEGGPHTPGGGPTGAGQGVADGWTEVSVGGGSTAGGPLLPGGVGRIGGGTQVEAPGGPAGEAEGGVVRGGPGSQGSAQVGVDQGWQYADRTGLHGEAFTMADGSQDVDAFGQGLSSEGLGGPREPGVESRGGLREGGVGGTGPGGEGGGRRHGQGDTQEAGREGEGSRGEVLEKDGRGEGMEGEGVGMAQGAAAAAAADADPTASTADAAPPATTADSTTGDEANSTAVGIAVCESGSAGLIVPCPKCGLVAKEAEEHVKALKALEGARPELAEAEKKVVGKWNPSGTFEVVKGQDGKIYFVGIDDDLDEIKGELKPNGEFFEGMLYTFDRDEIGRFRLAFEREGVVMFYRGDVDDDEWEEEGTPAYMDLKFNQRRPSTAVLLETGTKMVKSD